MRKEAIMFNDLIQQSRLEKMLKRLCASVKMGCCIIDAVGRIIIDEAWCCFGECRQNNSDAEPVLNCMRSRYSFANRVEPDRSSHVFTCSNGFSSVGVPVQIEGEHLASIFIGPFLLEEKGNGGAGCAEKQMQPNTPGFPTGLAVCSPERIRQIRDHLEFFAEIIGEMGRNQIQEKRVNTALKRSEERYKTLFDSSHDALILIGNRKIIDCNRKAVELFRTPRESIINSPFSALVNSLDTQSCNPSLEHVYGYLDEAQSQEVCFDWSFGWGESSIVETEVLVNSIKHTERDVVLMTLRNVTQERTNNRDLEMREAAWQALFQHAPFGITISRLSDGLYLDVNPAIEKSTGRNKQEIIGRIAADFYAQSQKSKSQEVARKLQERGFIETEEAEVLRMDGSAGCVLYSAATFNSGEDLNVVSMVIDITDRKEIEQRLQQSEATLQSLYQAVPVGLAIIKDRVIQTANEHFTELTGYPISSLLNQNSRFLYFSDEQYDAVGKSLLGKINSTGRGYVETTFRHKDGSTRFVSMFAAPLGPHSAAVAVQDITEQKRMIQALEGSEERFRQVSYFSGQLILDYDVKSDQISWYGRVDQMTGFSSDELNTQGFSGWFARMHPEDRDSIRDALDVSKQNRTLFKAHFRYCKADSDYLYAYAEGRFFYDQNGDAVRLLGTMKNITQTKLAEIAIKKSELRYRMLFEGASDAITIMQDGVFVDCNQKTLELFNCKRSYIIGKSPVDISPARQPDGKKSQEQSAQFLKAVEQGQLSPVEWVHRRQDGSTFFSEISLQSVELEGERLLQSIIRDITEKKNSEKSLRESEFRFRSFFNTNPEGILLVDFQGIILDANNSFIQKSGYALSELRTQSILNYISGNHKREISEALDEFRRGIRRDQLLQTTYAAKDGKIIPVSYKGWLITDEKSNPLYLGVFIRDLTLEKALAEEKVALEKQVIRSQKSEAIGTLAGGIAHDFNNILGGIIGYTELALYRDPAALDNKTREYLERVSEGSNRAKELVRQILRFSRNTNAVMEPIPLAPLMQEALLLLRSTLPATITIRQDVHTSKDKILGDATQIHQVIMNLATNASHAMKESGGVVTLSMDSCILKTSKQFMNMTIPPGEYIKITVADTGCGMTAGVVERIFDPYFTTKKIDEGTGLGMAVVSGIVKSHKGLIDIQTEPAQGTVFDIYLPAFQGETVHAKSHELNCPRGNGEKILIVDDETYFLEFVYENLKTLGYNAQAIQSSMKALETIQANPHKYDLLVTDQTMPEMTGVQLIEEIRKINSTIPVILCTGFSEVVTEDSASYYGVDRFLMKPVSIHELARNVHEILAKAK